MHQRVMKFLFAPLVLLALTLGFAAPSFAADTWRPSFNSSQHVYIDPALKGGSNPVNADGLEAQLQAEGKKHGIEFFFVMALKGDENTPGNVFAVTRLREVMGNWTGQSGFPADRAVIIYVVRLNSDWTKSAVADNVASELGQQGIDKDIVFQIADHYSQHRTSNPDALLPQNPKGFALKVAQGANETIDQHIAQVAADKKAAAERAEAARQQAERDRLAAIEHAKTMHTVMVSLAIGVPILLVLIFLGVMYTRKRKAYNAAAAKINSWDGLFQTANGNYIQLDGQYLDFLKQQGDNWKDKFKGKTLTRYSAALTDYATLSARIQTANKLIDAAKKANDSGNIFSITGNEHAIALLTTMDVTIDGKAVSFENQGLFGALLDSKPQTMKPDELLNDMDALFRNTNKTMADIMAAFEGSAKNKADIERLFGTVEASKATLTATGLSFDAYQGDFNKLQQAKDAFLAILGSDPLEAFEESEVVEKDCEALNEKIGHAIELRKSLSSTDQAIKTAEARINEVRGKAADYNYPDGGAPAAGASANYLLKEPGNNPDDALNEAKEELASSIALVVAGKLGQSKEAKANAEAHAQAAVDMVAKILAAKDLVQKQVPQIHSALDKLTAEIPGGDTDLASLNAGFLPKNFDSAPGQLKRAKAVKDSTTGQLAAVKLAFFEQRFVAAAELVTTVTGDIQGSRNGIVAIHTRLGELIGLRDHAKKQTASNAQTMGGLTSKIATETFTTSAATDSKLTALKPTLGNQQTDVAKPITDWPAAAEAADAMAKSLAGVDSSIDSEKAAYQHTVGILGQLRQAVSTAVTEGNTDANIVRSQAKSLIAQAQQILAQAEADIKQPKSDWNALSRRFETNVQTANSAHQAAVNDKTAYNEAVAAYNAADQHIRAVESGDYSEYRSIGGRYSGTFGSGVSANCSTARSILNGVSGMLRSQRYEDAEREAGRASSAADQAKAQAEAEVNRLIAIAVAAWEAEEAERRRREEEERRRREEQERRDREAAEQRRRDDEARNSSNNSGGFGGGFSGSDNSSGGGFSGSDNSTGGGFS